ncbi:CRISPR-associated protein Cas5/CasD [Leptospira ryugenii]|uniref:CRISPR-associated protein Cas5/CasD n=1 Tax=Leptospira ryugenii TaxID=1917863 RepID=A0A2P2E1H3_9LEPT|nr:type I-E CRISPR-associated protein Cas5/CasD [Leptospira ryugenii]GBF50735.1 CRISPR-associated protein Cas5/CasD [Leptospira ryugenii]
MKDYLVFRLYGPIASWGEIAVGENRHSFSYPSKSAIMGLLASALGYKREEEEKHILLTQSLSFGVKVYSPGILLRDYHTVQVPPSKGKIIYSTRKDELREKLELNTILSSRDYRMDAMYDVCIRKKKQEIDLVEIQKKLNEPIFSLFLGRKSCVLSSPVFASLVNANDLFLAFSKYEQNLKERFKKENINYFFENEKLKSNFIEYIWEDEGDENADIRTRRDEVLSRKRWQFSERKEFYKSEVKQNVPIQS